MLINDDYRKVELTDPVDLIIIDIPYNIGLDAYASNPQWWKKGEFKNGKSEKAESLFFETDKDFNIEEMLSYIQKNLKDDGKAVIFCSHLQQFDIISLLKKYKFNNYTPLVFIKNNSAEVLKANMRIVGACEYGLVIYKTVLGKFNNNGKMIKNYFEFKLETKKQHPTQKPVKLIEQFIELYTDEGDTVLDFVMGSGTTGVAAKNLNRKFIGIEIEEKYFNIARSRLYGDEVI